MNRIFLLTITVSLFFSCSPQKKLNKLIKKHPELFTHDTVVIRDTVTINAVSFDTVMRNVVTHDTIVITKDRLQIKYFNNGETVYLSGKCDTIKVPYEVKVPKYDIKYVENCKTNKYIICFFAGFLTCVIFFIYFNRR